jgi:hypothetical protein
MKPGDKAPIVSAIGAFTLSGNEKVVDTAISRKTSQRED